MSQILINGTNISSVNTNVSIYGILLQGVTKITYTRNGKHTMNYSLGAEPTSIGFGQYTYTGSIEMYTDTWEGLYGSLGFSPLSATPQQMDISITPTTDSVLFPYTDSLYNVKFLDDTFTVNSGDTRTLISVNFILSGFDRFF